MKIISVLVIEPGVGHVTKKTFLTHLVSYHSVGPHTTELEFTFGHKMLIAEDAEHFEWRLRWVMDNDQTGRHEYIHEPVSGVEVPLCLICYTNGLDNWIHGSARVISYAPGDFASGR